MNGAKKLTTICDQLVAELEAGDIDAAILQLSGTLDGALAAGADGKQLRDFLWSHPIFRFFPSDQNGEPCQRSTTNRMRNACFKIVSEKALKLRQQKTAAVLRNAWRGGAKICSFDPLDLTCLKDLAGRDLTNIEFSTPSETFGRCASAETQKQPSTKLDLILAASVADELSAEAFHNFLCTIMPRLSAGGQALISFFPPQHAGLGWRLVRNPARAFCHEEPDVFACAALAGFLINSYSDPNGCMIWAELRRKKSSEFGGGQDYE